jgi:hypothetical protein
MDFVLAGFHQIRNLREYRFQGVSQDRKRAEFRVGVDLAAVRRYGIPLQELPLLCRRLLEGCEGATPAALIFTEKDMRGYADDRAARREAAEEKKRAIRRRSLLRHSGGAGA